MSDRHHRGPMSVVGSHEFCKCCLTVAAQNHCPVYQRNVKHFEELSMNFPVSHVYPMESKPRGICLIISNKKFGGPGDRLGTERDVESLSTVFDWLGFKMLLCMDQKATQIETVVKVISQMKRMSDPKSSKSDLQYLAYLKKRGLCEYVNGEYFPLLELPQHGDAFICSILSHGEEGGVLGVDHEVVPINKLLSPFNGENCPSLIGKPKVFFIQACRGGNRMGTHRLDVVDAKAEPHQKPGSSRNYLPSEADFLIVEATVQKYVSFRNPDLGSYFIQALCHELILHCPKGEDIMHILTEVNEKVSEEYSTQISEATFTLRKRLLFPVSGPYPGRSGSSRPDCLRK